MPEIKNTFLQGKMNKDLDERLVPNGQYRDAINVEVSTSEGSDVGAVKNILGNKKVDKGIVPPGFTCVGSIANEKTNKLYWFISSYAKDAIIEHDIINDKTDPVIIDLNAGNSKAVLKFSGNTITGINIINNLLFWTDNNSEPKKINIDECKKGTTVELDGTWNHTQLLFENGSFDALSLEIVAKYDYPSTTSGSTFTSASWPPLTPVDEMTKSGAYFYYQRKPMIKLLGLDFDDSTDDDGYILNGWHHTNGETGNPYGDEVNQPGNHNIHYVRHYRNNQFLGLKQIRLFDNSDGTHSRNDPNFNGPIPANDWDVALNDDWHVGDVIFGNNITIDIEERHITVIKPKPLKAPTTKINHTQTLDSPSNIPNLFETTFPRFSYRYKYKDGEFSAFAPFTEPVFNPRYTKDINNTSGTNVFYTKDNVYDIKDPHNKAMVNSIHSVELTDFITAETPEDVIEIEVLYKQENSSVIYSIETIKQTDAAWHRWSNNEGGNIGFGKQIRTIGLETALNYNSGNIEFTYAADGGYTKGKYVVTTENIHAALPANQLLRPWDNVPRKALGQEITGNRIVYGNYLQNYNLGNIKPEIKVGYNDRNNQLGTFENKGLPSIKSQRNYQLGVIYCDKYGRETPVFTYKEGAVNIPWQKADGTKNASKSLQLNASVVTNFPEWVDSFKFFIKETSSPYYNLVMDQAWLAKSTYELDRGDHLWISFPSSDRNKISEEDYIILKKKIGTGEEQIAFENKFKVIDIANEAPDAIKYELINYGSLTNDGGALTNFFNGPGATDNRIDKLNDDGGTGVDTVIINREEWVSIYKTPLSDNLVGEDNPFPKDLYISWRRLSSGTGVSSKKYKISGGRVDATRYIINLSTPIARIDADIAHHTGDASAAQGANLHTLLIVQIEKKELKDSEDFSGKFFVKISKNQVTDLIEEGSTTDVLDNYIVSAKTKTWYWWDDVGSSIKITSNQNGLTNYGGFEQVYSAANNIQNIVQNQHSPTNTHPLGAVGGYNADGEQKLTDWAAAWNGIKSVFGPTFFIDSMYMAAGQSEASNQAKYCCVTWAGCTEGQAKSQETSSWSYPPFKVWLTDWIDSENVIENAPSSTAYGATAGSVDSLKGRFHDAIKSGLIETSPVSAADEDFKLLNEDVEGVKVTGWVGPSQAVDRSTPLTSSGKTQNHINGLEGIVTTIENHATGPRRWFSGITGNPTDQGVGVDTKTYSDDGEIGRHFMHLSFFAPGKDLHDGFWTELVDPGSRLYDKKGWGGNLQGIWGGGVFTGGNSKYASNHLLAQDRFGTQSIQFASLPMEGNYDPDTNAWLPETPGPGVGFGYDTSKNYQELHERQWDPTFNTDVDPDNKIRDFIKNLHAGSQFKFSNDPNEEVYTIKKVVTKKLYNHTSWRTPINRYQDVTYYHSPLEDKLYQSVEETGLLWLNQLVDMGQNTGANQVTDNFKNKIVDFGLASNRRLCYIIELDKNPTDQSFNVLETGQATPAITADTTDDEFANIEFLEKVQSTLLAGLNKFPAIWETDPKKQKVDLDIYYEASNNFPTKLNKNTNELIAPVGCKVEMIGPTIMGSQPLSFSQTSHLMKWDGTTAILDPGLPIGNDTIEIEYSGVPFKFTKEDGSYVILTADEQQLLGQEVSSSLFKTSFVFRGDFGNKVRMGLAWHNCFSFGNGLESNRIRDDFNEMFISNGVKASTTTQQIYEEEHRAHGLIYSGLYNSNSGVNDLNQFIMAEKITKDLNPTFGSIQKLFQRRISLIALCEDKVVSITSNKDALYNADGNPQLVATNLVLGDANPFTGEFGISKNPESFASESYRAYFTDKQRGAVIRLSKDGLTPISKTGMQDWFRDNLHNYNSLIGSYDDYKEDYNITLSHKFGENFVSNSFLGQGVELGTQVGSLYNWIINSGVDDPGEGGYFQYAYEISTNFTSETLIGDFEWGPQNEGLDSQVRITNHPFVEWKQYQEAQDEILPNSEVDPLADPATYATFTTTATTASGAFTGTVAGSYTAGTLVSSGVIATTAGGLGQLTAGAGTTGTIYGQVLAAGLGQSFAQAIYASLPGNNYGWWYDGRFTGVVDHLFGPNATNLADDLVYSNIKRVINGTSSGFPTSGWGSGYDPTQEKHIMYPMDSYVSFSPNSYNTNYGVGFSQISQAITRNSFTKAIVFDRPNPANSYVEFNNIGGTSNNPSAGINETYATNANIFAPHQQGLYHSSFFNGDEIHIQFELTCYVTLGGTSNSASGDGLFYGYNYIEPKIELFDGISTTPISSSILKVYDNFGLVAGGFQLIQDANGGSYDPYAYQQTTPGNMGTQFESSGYIVGTTSYNYSLHAISDVASSSSSVTFPNTHAIADLSGTSVSEAGTKTIVIGASFKFIDPLQQNPNGTPIVPGTDITEVKVVDDLRIRISNAKSEALAGYIAGTSGNYSLRNQLWEINDIHVKKGFGVTAPHIGFAPPTPGIFSAVTTTFVAGTPATYLAAQSQWDDIPPADVPAFTEVKHLGFEWVQQNFGTNNSTLLSAQANNSYGPNFAADEVPYQLQNGAGASGSYFVPNNYDPLLPSPYSAPITGNPSAPVTYPFTISPTFSYPSPSSGLGVFTEPVIDNTLIVDTGIAGSTDITWDIEDDGYSWQTDHWYLVDVEFDDDPTTGNPNTGTGGDDGSVHVYGVADKGGNPGPLNDEGVGVISGNLSLPNSPKHCQLIPTLRTEYGNEETVLRGIFKVDNGSYIQENIAYGANYDTPQNEFRLRFFAFENYAKITRVIVKRMDAPISGGTAPNWAHGSDILVHSFSKKKQYYKDQKLCWDIKAQDISSSSSYFWKQALPSSSLLPTPAGYTLKFTVSDNPDYPLGDYIGLLRVYCNNDIGPNGFEGVYYKDIAHTGDYEINFNFTVGSTEISPGVNWSIYRDNVDYGSEANGGNSSSSTSVIMSPNHIWFAPMYSQTTDFRMAISNLSLIDNTLIFQGGTSGSWNWDGFFPSLESYIYWDIDFGRIQFGELDQHGVVITPCPFVDPDSTASQKTPINANQWLNRTINRYETYNIEFENYIDQGRLDIYYFNSEGFGFRIPRIGNWTDKPFSTQVMIGKVGDGDYSEKRSSSHPAGQQYKPELQETLVIVPSAFDGNGNDITGSNEVVGWIDAIKMTRVYNVDLTQNTDSSAPNYVVDELEAGLPVMKEKTITFSEDVNGWTSFKSFVPESGVSLSKKYFTFDNGGLFKHYVPLAYNKTTQEWIDSTAENAENYNIFYGNYHTSNTTGDILVSSGAESKIKFVLNNEPSVVKMFNTLNYEGTQSHIKKPEHVDFITVDNALAWTENMDVQGWKCVEIKTDLEAGSVIEFIKKEGKWFNYIKGKPTQDLDTSRFSVQGIGISVNVTQ